MIFIPEDIQINSLLKQGAVFYFQEISIHYDIPHFFIILIKILKSVIIIYIVNCTSSDINKIKKLYSKKPTTIVSLIKNNNRCDYVGLTKSYSIINCNEFIGKTREELIQKRKDNILKLKKDFPSWKLKQIIKGVNESDLWPPEIKKYVV